jgi:hypothetical protein
MNYITARPVTVLVLFFTWGITPACSIEQNSASISSNSPSMIQTPKSTTHQQATRNWKEVRLEHFSFYIPHELKVVKVSGTDSAVWKYTSTDLEFFIDLGFYSGKPLNYKDEPEYREEEIEIDGKKATLCFFRLSKPFLKNLPYVAAIFFPDIGMEEIKLSFLANCASPHEQGVAKEIFLSIKFN